MCRSAAFRRPSRKRPSEKRTPESALYFAASYLFSMTSGVSENSTRKRATRHRKREKVEFCTQSAFAHSKIFRKFVAKKFFIEREICSRRTHFPRVKEGVSFAHAARFVLSTRSSELTRYFYTP